MALYSRNIKIARGKHKQGYKLQTGEQVDCGVGHCIHPGGVGSTCGPLMAVETFRVYR